MNVTTVQSTSQTCWKSMFLTSFLFLVHCVSQVKDTFTLPCDDILVVPILNDKRYL